MIELLIYIKHEHEHENKIEKSIQSDGLFNSGIGYGLVVRFMAFDKFHNNCLLDDSKMLNAFSA